MAPFAKKSQQKNAEKHIANNSAGTTTAAAAAAMDPKDKQGRPQSGSSMEALLVTLRKSLENRVRDTISNAE
ncbi:hypothetical protein M0804_004564 [Polistes exclamans]|nr:hypothetical protein M0804_004564 [Polistes exclamans]